MDLELVHGDLADREADVLVNAWNRNFIPYWLLIPQGVSRSLRRRGGSEIFRELWKRGVLPLGGAVATGAGRLRARWVIHAAALHAYWRASPRSVTLAVRNTLTLAHELGARTIAMPLLGAGTGGLAPEASFEIIKGISRAVAEKPSRIEIVVFDARVFARLTRGD